MTDLSAKNDFEKSYAVAVFGTSPAAVVVGALNDIFFQKEKKDTRPDLKKCLSDYADIIKNTIKPTDPQIAIYLCATYAFLGKKDDANKLLDFLFKNEQPWRLFADGHEVGQKKCLGHALSQISFELRPGHKRKIDLINRAMILMSDSYLIKDIKNATQGNNMQGYGHKLAMKATEIFPEDAYVAQAAIDLASDDKKIETLEYFCERFPDDVFMHSTLGNCYIHANRANEGVEFLSRHIDRFPDDVFMQNTLGNCYIHANRANEGVEFLSRHINRFPDNEAMHHILGNCYIHANRANEGVKFLGRHIDRFPDDAIMHNTLGNCYIHANRANEGVKFLGRHIDRFPDNAIMHNIVGNCYIHANRANEGVKFLSRHINRFPDDAIMHNTLGNCYIHANRANEGVKLLSRHINRFSDDIFMHNTLGIAAVEAKMKKVFDWVKPKLNMPKDQIDYLEAKMAFLDGRLQDTKDILAPYIRRVEKCKHSMIGLYLACVPDEDGIHALLPMMKRETAYKFLLERKAEWEKNPLRDYAIEHSSTYSSAWRIYDEGRNSAASRGDRKAAGGTGKIPVGVKITRAPR